MLIKNRYKIPFFVFIAIVMYFTFFYLRTRNAEHTLGMNTETNTVKFSENLGTQIGNSTSASRRSTTEQEIRNRKKTIHYFESISNIENLSDENLMEAISIAEHLGANDPVTGIEVLKIINVSNNYSLKYNYCSTLLMHLDAKNFIYFYNFAKENPIIIDKYGNEFPYREVIASRIFNFSRADMQVISDDFRLVEDSIILNSISERMNNINK